MKKLYVVIKNENTIIAAYSTAEYALSAVECCEKTATSGQVYRVVETQLDPMYI